MKITFEVVNNYQLSGEELAQQLLETEILMNSVGKLRYHLIGGKLRLDDVTVDFKPKNKKHAKRKSKK